MLIKFIYLLYICFFVISLLFTSPAISQEIFTANEKKTATEIAGMLADKFIMSKPEIYYTYSKDETYYPWEYTTGVTFWALCQVSDLTGDSRYLDFVKNSFNYYLDNDKVRYDTIDLGGAMGLALLELDMLCPDDRYKNLLIKLTNYFEHDYPRLLNGSFCISREPINNRIWIDALFMLCPLLAKSAGMSSEPKRYDDVLRQFFNYTVTLQDPEIKLYYQGWGWGINRTTHSPGFWSRGNGWVIMAMGEVLKTIPEGHPGRDKLLGVYKDFAGALLKVQDSSGRWHQLLTCQDSFEETSGTAMIVYSFIQGYKNGWLSQEYKESAVKGFEGLKEKIDSEGNIYGTCIGTGTQNTLEDYYKRAAPVNDSHGIGPVILASCAVASLNR